MRLVISTREQWLERATEILGEKLFKQAGYTLPKVRVSVGFPGGGSARKRIGEHWHPKASNDGISQIFISPIKDDSIQVLDILVHELVHAIHPDAGHGKLFKQCAVAVGLTGQMRTTDAGPELRAKLEALVSEIGPYPHSKLNLRHRSKKQTTRLIKVHCLCVGDRGYIVRMSQATIDSYGAPICPQCACQMEP
jgi:hypothetical protein